MFGEYLKETRRLMEIKRYPTKIMIRKRSVAEHSWFVSEIAHGLALWEKFKFDKNPDLNIERVMVLAQKHDVIEAHTGDIMTPVKEMSKDFRRVLAESELNIMQDHILKTIPKSWGKVYMDIHQELTELRTMESKIVKAADLIDRVYECMDEIQRGNKIETEGIIVKDLQRLGDMQIISVDYFLKYSIKDLQGAYEYIPKSHRERLEAMDFSRYF